MKVLKIITASAIFGLVARAFCHSKTWTCYWCGHSGLPQSPCQSCGKLQGWTCEECNQYLEWEQRVCPKDGNSPPDFGFSCRKCAATVGPRAWKCKKCGTDWRDESFKEEG